MTDSLKDLVDYLAELQNDIGDNLFYAIGLAGGWLPEHLHWTGDPTDEDMALYWLGLDDGGWID